MQDIKPPRPSTETVPQIPVREPNQPKLAQPQPPQLAVAQPAIPKNPAPPKPPAQEAQKAEESQKNGAKANKIKLQLSEVIAILVAAALILLTLRIYKNH